MLEKVCVSKGDIAHHELFRLLPDCFPNRSATDSFISGKGINTHIISKALICRGFR